MRLWRGSETNRHALSALRCHDRYHVCCRRPLDVTLILNRLVSKSLKFSVDFYLASADDLIPAATTVLPNASIVFINSAEFHVLADKIDPARLPAIVDFRRPPHCHPPRYGQVVTAVHPPDAIVAEVTGAGDTLAGTFSPLPNEASVTRTLSGPPCAQPPRRSATWAFPSLPLRRLPWSSTMSRTGFSRLTIEH